LQNNISSDVFTVNPEDLFDSKFSENRQPTSIPTSDIHDASDVDEFQHEWNNSFGGPARANSQLLKKGLGVMFVGHGLWAAPGRASLRGCR
jgi:hypothetical protein